MTASFASRHCVVTGVTSGIGHATTLRLLAEGASVTGVGRDTEKLEALSAQLGPRFTPLVVDLARPDERARALERLRALGRAVDVVVSNAGEAGYASPLQIPIDDLRRLLEVNVCAPLELCQALVPSMSDGGHIVQISSVTARFVPAPKFAPYGMTKLAVERLLDALRLELQPRGIRVSSIAPGLVDTPIYDKVEGFEDARRRLGELVPAWLRPEDIADTIFWVLSRPPNVVVTDITVMPKGQGR